MTMTRKEYERLNNAPGIWFSPSHLNNQKPRTLMYGYTLDRNTFEVTLDYDGGMTVEVFNEVGNYETISKKKVSATEMIDLNECVPNKRAYPEKCDYEFCSVLKASGVYVPFTTYTDR